jgi:transcription-repair coupling factor (superfamily II helicase)
MSEYLGNNGISPVLDLNLTELPRASVCIISVGALSAGMEYPALKLAVYTEGQLSAAFVRASGKRRVRQKTKAASKL